MKCTSNKIINTHWRLGFEQNFAEDLLNTVDSKINDLSNLSRMEIDPDSYGNRVSLELKRYNSRLTPILFAKTCRFELPLSKALGINKVGA